MTTLTAGSSITLTPGDGAQVTVSTNGGQASVSVTQTTGEVQATGLGPLPERRTFGPFKEGATVVIANQTAVLDYDSPTAVPAAVQALVSRAGNLAQPAIIGVCSGNSISANSWFNTSNAYSSYNDISELAYALMFAGPVFRQVANVTAGSHLDICGNYGFAGANLSGGSGILSELATVHFAALDAAGVVPGFWWVIALVENDIANDVPFATIMAAVNAYIASVRAKYPGILFHLCTSRPDSRLTGNSTRIATAVAVRAAMLALDNGKDIYVTDLSTPSWIDPANPWTPLQGYTFSGGTSDALSTVSIHPRQNAASINGRTVAVTLNRIFGAQIAQLNEKLISPNPLLSGTTGYSSFKTTGTVPTGGSTATTPTGAAAAIVSTALQNGWRIVFTPDSGLQADQLQVALAAGYSPAPFPGQMQSWTVVKVNSGAASICAISGRMQVNGTAAAQKFAHINSQPFAVPGVTQAVFQDGDLLYFPAAPRPWASGGTVQTLFFYVHLTTNGLTPVDLTILAMGGLQVGNLVLPQTITPTTGVAWQNTTSRPITVYPVGATITALTISRDNNATTALATTAPFWTLQPGDWMTVTFSAGTFNTFNQ